MGFATIHVMGAIQPRYSLLPCNLMIPQQQTAWKERNVQDMILVIQSVTVRSVVVIAARALTKCFFAAIHVVGAIQPRYSHSSRASPHLIFLVNISLMNPLQLM